MSSEQVEHFEYLVGISAAGSWGDVLTNVQLAAIGLGGAAVSVGVLDGVQVRTFNRGFGGQDFAKHDAISLFANLPGPAVVRSLQPLFFESAVDAANHFPETSTIGLADRFQAAACAPLVCPLSGPLGYVALHFEIQRKFTAEDRAMVLVLAATTAGSLRRTVASAGHLSSSSGDRREFPDGADVASEFSLRAVVEQAKGVLIERYELTAQQAYDVLLRFAMSVRLPMSQVARQLVTGSPMQGLLEATVDVASVGPGDLTTT